MFMDLTYIGIIQFIWIFVYNLTSSYTQGYLTPKHKGHGGVLVV